MDVLEYLKGGSHHDYGCSKYNAWDKCIHFESEDIDPTDLQNPANRGTLQHALLEQKLKNKSVDKDLLMELTSDEVEGVEWAYDYITNCSDNVQSELKVAFVDEDWNELYNSTADAVWEKDDKLYLFDLKTGEKRDYKPQMKGYGLALMQMLGYDECVCIVGYSKFEEVEEFVIEYDDALDYVTMLLDCVKNKSVEPKTCDYCAWCKNSVTCPAVIKQANNIAVKYSENTSLVLNNVHSSEIVDPEQMKIAWDMMKVLEAWCKSVKKHAVDMVVKQGITIPGLKLSKRKGSPKITDNLKAIEELGYSDVELAQAMSLNMTKLVDIESKKTGLSKAKAKANVLNRLSCVEYTADSFSLKASK